MSLLGSIWKHPANQNRRIAALARAVHWQISKRLTGKPADIDYHGLVLRCFPNSHSASRAIYFRDYPDFNEMRFMRDYLRPGDKFIDVGANVGLYTLLARALVGQSGHVDSFEPMKATFKQLREEIDLNKLENVAIHNLAVSDVTGFVSFNETTDDCTAHVSPAAIADPLECSTKSVRLDEFLPAQPYAMMKLDIEGHEPMALRGASSWLRNGNPTVLQVEMAGYSKRYGVTTTRFIQELGEQGYSIAVYAVESRTLVWTDRPWEVPTDNVLAISDSSRQFVFDRLADSAAHAGMPYR